jgi:NitT/TauT family transport system substrate-binding protein
MNAPLRALLLVLVALVAPACRRSADPRVLRLGYFPNLTHTPALTGVASGRFAAALGRVRLETRVFQAGPEAMEALLSGAIDAAYVGPSPVLNAWTASRGRGLRVIAGAASGGALFVVRPSANIHGAADLHGKRLATPQLGNTQDIALRNYLAQNGLATTDRGGDVTVTALGNPDILTQFRLGQLDGAWVPEPWAARLVAEAGGVALLDERDLWPARIFPTTLLVVTQTYARDAPENVRALLRAHLAEVAHLREASDEARAETNRALAHIVGRPLPEPIVRAAWAHIDFTTDPMEAGLARDARAAHELHFLRSDDVGGLVDNAERARALTAAGAR